MQSLESVLKKPQKKMDASNWGSLKWSGPSQQPKRGKEMNIVGGKNIRSREIIISKEKTAEKKYKIRRINSSSSATCSEHVRGKK